MKKQSKKKIFKKPLTVLLAVAMVLSGLQDSSAYALETTETTSQDGKKEVLFEVSNASDFVALQDEIPKYDKLETKSITIEIQSDIDLTAVRNWKPIDIETTSIQLYVDGGSHTVSNLTVESGGNAGIFGALNCQVVIDGIYFNNISVSATGENVGIVAGKITGDGAEFYNVNVIHPTINVNTANVGGVVGYFSSKGGSMYYVGVYNNDEEEGSKDDYHYTGTDGGVIKGKNCVGGIVGCLDGGTIQLSRNHVSVAGKENVGGLVGCLGTDETTDKFADIIDSNYNYGNVEGNTNVGGVVGSIKQSGSCGTEPKIYNYGTVTGDKNVGGIVGSNAGTISADLGDTPVQNQGEVKGGELGVNIGGVCGLNTGSIRGARDCADVTGGVGVGAIAGKNEGDISRCESTLSKAGGEPIKIRGNENVGGIAGDNAGSVTDSTNCADVTGNKNAGGITGVNSTKDSSVIWCTNSGAVNGTGTSSSNIGGITGENNGIISGILDKDGNIAKDDSGKLKVVTNYGDVTGDNNVGGIAGSNKGEIKEKCINNGVVSGKENVGGIAGDNAGSVEKADNHADVTGNKNVGGITGINSTKDSSVTGCTNDGEVIGREITDENGEKIPSSNIGGISGENDGTISSSTNGGNVSGDNNVGGIAGINKGDIKDNCVNTGDISGKENVGGIAGENQGNISDAKNKGAVDGEKNVGGLAGKNEGNISNSTNEGDVTGKDAATTGGLVGVNETPTGDNSNITNSANTGTVNGEPASEDKNVGQNVKKEIPPSTSPSQEPAPSTDPSQEPAPSTDPSQEPASSTDPSQEPASSTSPSPSSNAGTSPSPVPSASTSPSPVPSASATPNPDDVQYGTPSYNTGGTNVINYITNPTSATWDKQVRFGYIFTAGNYTYRITKSTLIGDAVNAVEVYRVANRSLKTITIKNQVKLGTQAYNIVAIRNDVAKKYASVTKINIGDKVTKIGSRAFMGCKKLKSVNIDSKKLTKIGINAFSGCKKLKKVVIVSSRVKSVGKNAFKNTAKKLVIDVPNKKAKAYKKVFAKSGKAKKAVIK